jgi:signal transduction histidine kinase
VSRGLTPGSLSEGPGAGAPSDGLPERVEVPAYCGVSEALTNAATHANASVVNVELDAVP